MPLDLTLDQLAKLIEQMGVITGVKGSDDKKPTMGYGLYKGKVLSDNRKLGFVNGESICNCWESILIAGKRAGLCYTDQDILYARKVTTKGEHVMAAYIFRNRRSMMFPEPKREAGWGIPSGLVKAGDVVMWGAGKHAALFIGEENVMEFERDADRKGVCKLNELDQKYCTDIVMFSPLPSPGELGEISRSVDRSDISRFTPDKREILSFGYGLGEI